MEPFSSSVPKNNSLIEKYNLSLPKTITVVYLQKFQLFFCFESVHI